MCKAQPCTCEQECINTKGCRGYSSKKRTTLDPYPRCRLFSEAQPIANLNSKVRINPGQTFTPPSDKTALMCQYHPGWVTGSVTRYAPGACNIDAMQHVAANCVGKRECYLEQSMINTLQKSVDNRFNYDCKKMMEIDSNMARLSVQVQCEHAPVSTHGMALASVSGHMTSQKGAQSMTGEFVLNSTDTSAQSNKGLRAGSREGTGADYMNSVAVTGQKVGLGYSKMISLPQGSTDIGFKFKSSTGKGRLKVPSLQIRSSQARVLLHRHQEPLGSPACE